MIAARRGYQFPAGVTVEVAISTNPGMALETCPFIGQREAVPTLRLLASLPGLALGCVMLSALEGDGLHAQDAPARASWGLFSARYDTRTSDFIYAVYGYGHSFAMVGTLQNPRSGWTELVAAAGRTFTIGSEPPHSIAWGIARAADGWYAQMYYVPTIALGPAWLRATAEWDVPVDRQGVMQFAFSPLSLTLPTVPFVETGVSMDLYAARGARTGVAAGPEVRVSIPGAVIGADLQRMTDGTTSRLRLFFTTQF